MIAVADIVDARRHVVGKCGHAAQCEVFHVNTVAGIGTLLVEYRDAGANTVEAEPSRAVDPRYSKNDRYGRPLRAPVRQQLFGLDPPL